MSPILLLNLAFLPLLSEGFCIPATKTTLSSPSHLKLSSLQTIGRFHATTTSDAYNRAGSQLKKPFLKLFSSKKAENEYEFEAWQAGDLQTDLQKLKYAVAESNAQIDLDQKKRLHLLDEFARQRRPFTPDLIKYVMRPLVLSSILFLCQFSGSGRSLGGGRGRGRISNILENLLKNFSDSFLALMNLYYIISILVPIVVYHRYRLSTIQSNDTIESKRESEYVFQFNGNGLDNDAEDPKNDCSNHSKCILENWVSSVYLSAILNCVMMIMAIIMTTAFRSNKYHIYSAFTTSHHLSFLFMFGINMSRFITRLGAAASLHQFPKLVYELRRSNQPRPIEFLPMLVKKMMDVNLFLLPFGFAADLTQLLFCVYPTTITTPIPIPSTLLSTLLSTLPQGCRILGEKIANWFKRGMVSLLALSIIVPLSHLIAFTRIVKVGKFTNISLAMNPEKAIQLMEQKQTDGFRLRYKLQWRPPMRLFHYIRHRLVRKFVLYFFTGWGEKVSIVDDNTDMTSNQMDSSKNEPYILTLVGREDQSMMGQNRILDRSTWVKDASERMAKIHQSNYDNKTFDVSFL